MEEGVSDIKTFAYKGCKIIAIFFFFFLFSRPILFYFLDYLLLMLLSASVERCFVSRMQDV